MEAQKDCLVRAISKDGFVNAVAVYTRGLTERARRIHHTSPVATAALGRALAACSMMGNALKDNGASVTMQIKGDGPLGTILTVSDSEGNVRGYVQNPAVDLALREDGKLDVGTAVGHSGTLTVIKDLNMREPYVGTVDLLGGEIAEDVAAYYVESEQVPSACGLGVLIDRDRSVLTAGGYLIQLLPGAGEDVITKVEGGIYAAPSVTNLLKENSDPAVLLKTVLSDFDMEILSVDPIEYRCYCSRERTERALLSLGSKELEQIVAEQGGAEKNSILCDIVESLIGATFLEHGIDEARKVIHRLIDDTLAEVATEGPALDWKTSLTVKAHGLGKEEPVYHMEVSGPEYAQIFTARVSLGENGDIIGIGKGSSKRKAQLAAAEAGWKSLDSFKTRTK